MNRMKIFCIINSLSGKDDIDFRTVIESHFFPTNIDVVIYELQKGCKKETIVQQIKAAAPDRVLAAGGDGTIKLIAECLVNSDIPMGILPAGSANGMAKELGIPLDVEKALETFINGTIIQIHLTKINDEICIHLSDIGFNAFVVKKFETAEKRGMWSYVKAAWEVLWSNPRMSIQIQTDSQLIHRNAEMVVIANATKYGTGVLINPEGSLTDKCFEVIVVKKISLAEIFKMRFTHKPYDPEKTELFQTGSVKINSRKNVHFQVDGEYLGKVKTLKASIIPDAIKIITESRNL